MTSLFKIFSMIDKTFSWKARWKSLQYAGAGIRYFLELEHNARLHLAATILVMTGIVVLRPSRLEIIALVMVIAIVWFAEMINTCIEKTLDFITPDILPAIKQIKDLAAAAVLVTSIAAFITGSIIFIPKIILYAQHWL